MHFACKSKKNTNFVISFNQDSIQHSGMTTKQENKLTMYATVVSYLDKNLTQVQSLPQFTTLLADLKAYIAGINAHSTTQQTGTKGYAKQKSNLKNTLVEIAVEVLNALKAFAALTGNVVLTGEINYTPSKLLQTPDTILSDKVQVLLTKAGEHLPALADYGITQTTLDSLQQANTAYMQSITDPRTGTITRKGATTSLADTFAKADDLLNNKMDLVIELLRLKDATTYTAYRSARKIMNMGSRKQKEEKIEE